MTKSTSCYKFKCIHKKKNEYELEVYITSAVAICVLFSLSYQYIMPVVSHLPMFVCSMSENQNKYSIHFEKCIPSVL